MANTEGWFSDRPGSQAFKPAKQGPAHFLTLVNIRNFKTPNPKRQTLSKWLHSSLILHAQPCFKTTHCYPKSWPLLGYSQGCWRTSVRPKASFPLPEVWRPLQLMYNLPHSAHQSHLALIV